MPFEDENGDCLEAFAQLDTLVTVVDARHFLNDYASTDELRDRRIGLDESDDRNVVDLLVDQVEFADVIVLNKLDLVSSDEQEHLEQLVKLLNPTAEIIPATFGRVPLNRVLNTGRFSLDQAGTHPQWLVRPRDEIAPETIEYGISSFVFRDRRPFHPQRLWDLLMGEALASILRSKGLLWLATRMDQAGLWSQAGQCCRLSSAGYWWAAVDRDAWPESPDEVENILERFGGPYGDRRQEIVLIGQDLDRVVLESALELCLLTDEEMTLGPETWSSFPDPWGAWAWDELNDTDRGTASLHEERSPS